MGMFDHVHNGYKPLGKMFLEGPCQTKDLECCMCSYWISPAGELFEIDERGTFDTILTPEEELEGLSPIERLTQFSRHVPNGNHGKVHPVYHLGRVKIYPANWEGEWEDWPEAILHMVYGKIEKFELQTFRTTRC